MSSQVIYSDLPGLLVFLRLSVDYEVEQVNGTIELSRKNSYESYIYG